MPKEKNRASGTVTTARKPKLPVIVRNVPSRHNWDWHSREDQRMHLKTLGEVPAYKVWLEEKGERAFEPAGKVPPKLLKPLREFLAEHRQAVEDMWVRFMLDQGWLAPSGGHAQGDFAGIPPTCPPSSLASST